MRGFLEVKLLQRVVPSILTLFFITYGLSGLVFGMSMGADKTTKSIENSKNNTNSMPSESTSKMNSNKDSNDNMSTSNNSHMNANKGTNEEMTGKSDSDMETKKGIENVNNSWFLPVNIIALILILVFLLFKGKRNLRKKQLHEIEGVV